MFTVNMCCTVCATKNIWRSHVLFARVIPKIFVSVLVSKICSAVFWLNTSFMIDFWTGTDPFPMDNFVMQPRRWWTPRSKCQGIQYHPQLLVVLPFPAVLWQHHHPCNLMPGPRRNRTTLVSARRDQAIGILTCTCGICVVIPLLGLHNHAKEACNGCG